MVWLTLLIFALFVRWTIKVSAHPEKLADPFRPFFRLVRADVQAIVRDTRAWRDSKKDHSWVDEVPDWMDR